MKRVVFLDDLRESEIRPDSLYHKYKDILEKEIAGFFPDQSRFIKINCPGCGERRFKKAFVKLGFQYCKCSQCGSLFVSPRPTAEMLENFYRNSEAVSFWRDTVARRTKESRYRHQSFPMARWVLELVDEYLPEAKIFLDYDSKYPDFLSTINEAKSLTELPQ